MYCHSFVRVGTLLVSLLLALAARPAADEVVSITGGTFVFDTSGLERRLDIFGTRGFKAEAVPLAGFFSAFDQCQSALCEPGAIVPLTARWSGNDLPGTGQIRGTTYPDLGGLDSPNSLRIAFAGTVTMPPLSDAPVTITAPFEFAGLFGFAAGLGEPHEQALLAGGGRVTLELERFPTLESWRIARATFEFRPLPQR